MKADLQVGKKWKFRLGENWLIVIDVSFGAYMLFGIGFPDTRSLYAFFGPFGLSIEVV